MWTDGPVFPGRPADRLRQFQLSAAASSSSRGRPREGAEKESTLPPNSAVTIVPGNPLVANQRLLPLKGKTLEQIAKERGKDPIDTLMDILVEDEGFTSNAVFGMSESDVALALQQPWTSVDFASQGTAPDGILGKE